MHLSEDNPLRYWTDSGLGSGIDKAAATYRLPPEKSAKSITAHYRAKSMLQAAQSSRLAGYIDPACRLDSGMDGCLTIQNPRLRNLAINWRCNTFGIYRKCSRCKSPFTRGHVQCVHMPMRYALAARYAEANRAGEAAASLTLPDFLLNKREYSIFQRYIELIQANLDQAR